MILIDNLPWSTINKVGFRRVIKKIIPEFDLKSDKYFRTTFLKDNFVIVNQKILEIL